MMHDERPLILVTGGRTYSDAARVDTVLTSVANYYFPGFAIVQGGAPGADTLARLWCRAHGFACFTADATWTYYGKRAGGIRNGWMLDFLSPDFVLAFPGGPGTADMVRRATVAGVPVYAC